MNDDLTNEKTPWHTPRELWARLKPEARQMRHAPTPEEAVLWQILRAGRLAGLKFRRQHAIGRFIVDFYCPESRLVVEVDGPIHDNSPDQDEARDELLKSYGLTILRLKNEEVRDNIDEVRARIVAAVTTSPLPLSARGEGFGER